MIFYCYCSCYDYYIVSLLYCIIIMVLGFVAAVSSSFYHVLVCARKRVRKEAHLDTHTHTHAHTFFSLYIIYNVCVIGKEKHLLDVI